MSRPKVNVLYSPGTNCHHETAEAFKLAGADPSICNLTDLLNHTAALTDCDLLAIPGGFSFGDHVAAGRIFAVDLIHRLADQLREVKEKEIPMIGICNGFQVLINTGLLPGDSEVGDQTAILDRNNSAVFESRWVDIYIQPSDCVWTEGLAGSLHIPVAHGEGRLVTYTAMKDSQVVFRYGSMDGTQHYPENPNGSIGGQAGICDTGGRILGLMPHPERAVFPWLGSTDGLKIFRAGVNAVK